MKAATPLLLMAVLLAGPANAAVSADSCNADAQKYCPNVKPGGGAIDACLKKNEKSLSPACTQLRQDLRKKLTGITKACATDIKKHCASVKQGEGRIFACLKQHEASLGSECKNQVTPSAK
jgi:Golgi apparatus protein 1